MKIFPCRIFAFFLILMVLPSCGIKTSVQTKEGFDFKQVKTFSVFPRSSEFVNLQELSDFQRNRIEMAIEQSMESHQYLYVDHEQADVVVSYFWAGRSLKELAKYNSKVKACIGCTKEEKSNYNRKIRLSTLIIDVLDSKSYRSIYRNLTILKLNGKNNSEENQQIIASTVTDLLADFPLQ